MFITIVLFTGLVTKAIAIGDNVEDLATPASVAEQDLYQTEVSPIGPAGTKHYTNILNSRLKDLGLPESAHANSVETTLTAADRHLFKIQLQLNTERKLPSLLYLDLTPDERKVHAMLLQDASVASPHFVILSTPRIWSSMKQKIQLHTFAKVDASEQRLRNALVKEQFIYSPLDALARNALPKNSQSEFDKLIGRLPH